MAGFGFRVNEPRMAAQKSEHAGFFIDRPAAMTG
jgi:hypothetical protein